MRYNVRDASGKFAKRITTKKHTDGSVTSRRRAKKSETVKIEVTVTGRTVEKKNKKKNLEAYDLFILDKSSSMQSKKQTTIDGFNNLIDELEDTSKKKNIKSYCSLLQFSSAYKNMTFDYINTPCNNVKRLNSSSYQPSGMTALYDAIGFGITQLKNISKGGKDISIAVYIFTDGEENDSKIYDQSQIRELITDVRDNLNWTVNFIGAGEERVVRKAAQSIGIFVSNTLNYANTSDGVNKAMNAISSARSVSLDSYANTGESSNIGFFSKD